MRQVWLLVVGFFLLAFGYLAAVEAWGYYKAWQEARRREIEGLKKVTVRSRVCQRCNRNLSCMLNKSCLHMYLCQACWREGEEERCRECRRSVQKVIEMFVC